ncbi:MAG: hypothetical protein IJT49_00380 [Clostridia bacterium]|nr:hypothetical protein [Clostridia bacterium]
MTNDNFAFIGELQSEQKRKSGKQNKYFKSEAKRTLFAADNFYKAVISHFIAGAASGGFLFLTYYIPSLTSMFFSDFLSEKAVNTLSLTLNVILYTVFSAFFFAFFFGAYVLASKMKDEPDKEPGAPRFASLSSMLIPLNSLKNARRTFCLYLILAAELAVSVLPSVFVFSFIKMTELDRISVFFVELTVVLCSAFACVFFIMLFVPMPFVMAENRGAGAAELYKKSASAALCGIWRCYALLFSFLPLILLSILTFGVLFFAYTLPYMTVSCAKVGEYLYYLENPERKKENET